HGRLRPASRRAALCDPARQLPRDADRRCAAQRRGQGAVVLMAPVRLANITKRYPRAERPAVEDVSFAVGHGEFVALLGPSGCGKSTTLRMIAGLEEITAGELFIGERNVNAVPAKDRDIAMVFQSYALYPHMTIADNLAFGLRRRAV